MANQVGKNLKSFFGGRLFRTAIPRNVRLAEAPSHGQPALLYDIHSRGAECYIRLAKEILGRHAKREQSRAEKIMIMTAEAGA